MRFGLAVINRFATHGQFNLSDDSPQETARRLLWRHLERQRQHGRSINQCLQVVQMYRGHRGGRNTADSLLSCRYRVGNIEIFKSQRCCYWPRWVRSFLRMTDFMGGSYKSGQESTSSSRTFTHSSASIWNIPQTNFTWSGFRAELTQSDVLLIWSRMSVFWRGRVSGIFTPYIRIGWSWSQEPETKHHLSKSWTSYSRMINFRETLVLRLVRFGRLLVQLVFRPRSWRLRWNSSPAGCERRLQYMKRCHQGSNMHSTPLR